MSYLSIKNIDFSYKTKKVINSISLEISQGEITCLLGPSGCGKTTLLQLIAGLEAIDKGTIKIDGKIISDKRTRLHVAPEKRETGIMFQDYALFPHLSVEENIFFGVQNPTEKQKSHNYSLISMAKINEFKERFPHNLSGGQQQRIALIRALSRKPKIILLDEPFSGLDISLRSEIRDETISILKSLDVTTIIVTHDPQEALQTADQVHIMKDGRIEQSGSPREIYQFPANDFIARFIGETNILSGIILEPGYDEVMTNIGSIPCLSMRNLDFGTDAFISIRPESFALDDQGEFEARTEKIQYAGTHLLIEVTLLNEIGRGQQLKIHTHPNARVSIGEIIRFRIVPDFVTVIEDGTNRN